MDAAPARVLTGQNTVPATDNATVTDQNSVIAPIAPVVTGIYTILN